MKAITVKQPTVDALERSRDDRNRFRRAVRRGNLAEMGRLAPKRGWRY